MPEPYYTDEQVTAETDDERRRRQGRERQRRYRARKRGEQVPWQPRPRGYKQTPQHIQNRADAIRGENHYGWQGDDVSERGGRARALRAYPNIGPCEKCGAAKSERHHKDGNTANNNPANIEILCRRCHMTEDGRLDAVRRTPFKGCAL